MTEQHETSEKRLLQRAAAGDEQGWQTLLEQNRDRLKRMVAVRLDKRMQSRADASDVVQDTLVEAFNKLPEYLENSEIPFYLWLRGIAGNKLMTLHRFHLGTQRREAGREVSINAGVPETTAAGLVDLLAASESRPSAAVMREELKIRLQECIDGLDPVDREILMLRHFEQLTNAETARVLDIAVSAASKRYIRGLERLRSVLETLPEEL